MGTLHRVVILGGGFGGIRVARQLARHASRQHLAITLVNAGPLHTYTPALYALAGSPGATVHRKQLERTAALPIRRVLAGLPVSFLEARVADIDTASHRVTLHDGRTLSYDTLVIALGSEAAYYDIPGLEEHAITLKKRDEAMQINRRITELMRGRTAPLRVTIGGGGPTGVELTAMLAERLGAYQAGIEVTLIERNSVLLNNYPVKAQDHVLKQLTTHGVMVRTGHAITHAEAQSVTLDDGNVVPHDVLIWAGGTQAPALLSTLPFVTDHGRLVTDANLTTVPKTGEAQTTIYALGDATCFHYAGAFAPWTAHMAMKQADTIARNIMRHLKGLPPKNFAVPREIFLIPLGSTGGIGKILFFFVRGRIVQLFVHMIESWYLMTVLPFFTAIRLGIRHMRGL